MRILMALVAMLLALVVWDASLHASEEVRRFDFSDLPDASEFESKTALIREAAGKLCGSEAREGRSFWAYRAFDAVRESCGPEPESTPPLGYERFELWSGCLPMRYIVDVDDAAREIGLTSENVNAAVESRLRGARLYTTERSDSAFDSRLRGGLLYAHISTRSLHVDVRVLGTAFSSTLRFGKLLHDPASGTRGLADTWVDHVLGTHGRDGTYVLDTVSELLDRFIARYLRVNETSCWPS